MPLRQVYGLRRVAPQGKVHRTTLSPNASTVTEDVQPPVGETWRSLGIFMVITGLSGSGNIDVSIRSTDGSTTTALQLTRINSSSSTTVGADATILGESGLLFSNTDYMQFVATAAASTSATVHCTLLYEVI